MESPLGKSSTYPSHYAPEVLFAIDRASLRGKLGLTGELPFHGSDLWTAWDLSWLADSGTPRTATLELSVPAESPNIVESKSLKLYLNSLAMSCFKNRAEVADTIRRDLSRCIDAAIGVHLYAPDEQDDHALAALPGDCLDDLEVSCDTYELRPEYLESDPGEIVSESLHTHLLRSLCPVTDQPDIGSLLITYRGARIDPAGLLRYIVSYREHNDYHEHCVERIFVDIKQRCRPEALSVFARYQRRGGIDINPYRSDTAGDPPRLRVWRQ